ncbi:MerR family transcriptional regulator [Specibacter sp. NPDC078709]|uniref:helix-turn-helix domain-containing protein n=1 Tax=Specibacter sp. NPDC078709 TaxID=3154364 RepID=UPI00342764A7
MIDTPPPAATEQTMHIGDLADATGLSQRTIRHYDEVGLLPATTRSDGGFRIYTGSDLQRMLVIRSMKPLGFTLEEMGELLDTVDVLTADPENNDARELLAQYVQRANEKRDKLALNLKRADTFIQDLNSK